MDPEVALADLRGLTAEAHGIMADLEGTIRHGSQGEARLAEIGKAMAEQFEALDNWMTKTGAAPADWRGAGQEDHRV